jgi:hypothetical protein
LKRRADSSASSGWHPACRRFPKFDPVSLAIHDPAEFSKFRFLSLRVDLAAFSTELREERSQIFDPVVDHEGRDTRVEVIGIFGEDIPDRRSIWFRFFRRLPEKSNAAPVLDVETKMFAVLGTQSVRILCLDKNSADTRNSVHVIPQIRRAPPPPASTNVRPIHRALPAKSKTPLARLAGKRRSLNLLFVRRDYGSCQ